MQKNPGDIEILLEHRGDIEAHRSEGMRAFDATIINEGIAVYDCLRNLPTLNSLVWPHVLMNAMRDACRSADGIVVIACRHRGIGFCVLKVRDEDGACSLCAAIGRDHLNRVPDILEASPEHILEMSSNGRVLAIAALTDNGDIAEYLLRVNQSHRPVSNMLGADFGWTVMQKDLTDVYGAGRPSGHFLEAKGVIGERCVLHNAKDFASLHSRTLHSQTVSRINQRQHCAQMLGSHCLASGCFLS
jgi:hypothetical protein